MNSTIIIDNITYEIDIYRIIKLVLLVIILMSDYDILIDYMLELFTKYVILTISLSLLIIGSQLLYFDIVLGIISIFLGGSLFTLFVILNRL